MLNPNTFESGFAALAARPVRDGQQSPVTCAACGCRLQESKEGYTHFGGYADRDARGCRVPCAELQHIFD